MIYCAYRHRFWWINITKLESMILSEMYVQSIITFFALSSGLIFKIDSVLWVLIWFRCDCAKGWRLSDICLSVALGDGEGFADALPDEYRGEWEVVCRSSLIWKNSCWSVVWNTNAAFFSNIYRKTPILAEGSWYMTFQEKKSLCDCAS